MCVSLSGQRDKPRLWQIRSGAFPQIGVLRRRRGAHMQMSKPLPRDVMLANNCQGEGVFANAIERVICA